MGTRLQEMTWVEATDPASGDKYWYDEDDTANVTWDNPFAPTDSVGVEAAMMDPEGGCPLKETPPPAYPPPAGDPAKDSALNDTARNTNDTSKLRSLVEAGADLTSTNGPQWR